MTISGNITALFYAEEPTLKGTPAGPWYGLEPNSYANYGAAIKVVSRTPIEAQRSRKRGTTTDYDASGGIGIDFTRTALHRLMQGVFFADAREQPATQPINGSAVPMLATTATTYNAASGLTPFNIPNLLIFASGFAVPACNGLKVVTSATATAITTTGLGVEASPPAAAKLTAVGKQFAAGDLVATVAAGILTLTSTANALPVLLPGSWIYIGGDTAVTQFATLARGMVRVRTSTAAALGVDECMLFGGAAPVSDAGATKTIQIFFGSLVIKNENDPALIKRRTWNLERQMGPGNVTPFGTQAEYLEGAVTNEFTVNVPGQDKITCDMTFLALTNAFRTGGTGDVIKTGTRVASLGEDCYNTSSDFKFNKVFVIPSVDSSNHTPLIGYATECSISVKNNCTVDKAVGVAGGIDVNPGLFEVDASISAYFAYVDALQAVRANSDVGYVNGAISPKQWGFLYDMPYMQLATDGAEVELNTSMKVPLEAQAVQSKFGHTLLYQYWEYLPLVATA